MLGEQLAEFPGLGVLAEKLSVLHGKHIRFQVVHRKSLLQSSAAKLSCGSGLRYRAAVLVVSGCQRCTVRSKAESEVCEVEREEKEE